MHRIFRRPTRRLDLLELVKAKLKSITWLFCDPETHFDAHQVTDLSTIGQEHKVSMPTKKLLPPVKKVSW